MPEFLKSIWGDPVWSKVISVGIIALLGTAGTWIFNDQKTKWPIIGMIVCGVGFISCFVWYWNASRNTALASPTASGQSPNKPPPPPSLTLEDLFASDSPLGSSERKYDLSVKDPTTV